MLHCNYNVESEHSLLKMMAEILIQCLILGFVQLSNAEVASFSAITESVFHVGTSVTMMMTVGTRVMNRIAVSTSLLH